MTVVKKKNYHTIELKKGKITSKDITDLSKKLKSSKKRDILIDMKEVTSCGNEFFRIFLDTDKRISLINTDSQILTTLYMMKYDKYIRIYNESVSYENGKNELRNRLFSVA